MCFLCVLWCVVLHGSSQASAGSVGPGNWTVPPRSPCHRNLDQPTVSGPRRESAWTHCESEGERPLHRQQREGERGSQVMWDCDLTCEPKPSHMNCNCGRTKKRLKSKEKQQIFTFVKLEPSKVFRWNDFSHYQNERSQIQSEVQEPHVRTGLQYLVLSEADRLTSRPQRTPQVSIPLAVLESANRRKRYVRSLGTTTRLRPSTLWAARTRKQTRTGT